MYRLTQTEFIIYVLIAGMGIGFLLGLIPLITGIVKKKVKLGVFGLIASTLGGVLGLLLSVPIVVIFMWLILKNSTPAKVVVVNENPIDVNVSDRDVR